MKKKILSAMLLCALLGFSGVAVGQETDPAKLFETAETYYNVGEWEQALKNYKEAYILSKEPVLLYNMGQCYRQMNKYDEAIRTYKNFLKEVPDTNLRATVEKFIKELEDKKAAGAVEPIVVPATVPVLIPVVEPPVVGPTSAALIPATEPGEKPNKKVFLYAGIGGGVVVAGVLTGLLLSRSNEELQSTFGTFAPFPL